MAINFPDSPSVNDTYTVSGRVWRWDGTAWNIVITTAADHGNLAGLSDDDHTQYLRTDGTRTAASLTVSGAVTVDTDTFHVDSTNNRVGIGTTNPNAPLEVWNSISSLGAARIDGTLMGSNNNGYEMNFVGGTPDYTYSNVGGRIRLCGGSRGDSDIDAIIFMQDNTERMRIDSSGNFAIGRTSASHKLHVDPGTSGGIRVETDNDSVINFRTRNNARAWNVGNYYTTWNGLASPFIIQPTENSGSMDISITPVTNSPGSGLIIKADGRVCVGGDTNPAAHFTVKAAGTGNNDGLVEFHSWSGSASSPTEVEDWPTPVLALRAWDNFYAQQMLSFGYPQDAIYQTGGNVWSFRLESGYGATQSSTSTNLRLLGQGTFLVGNFNASGTKTFRIHHPLPELNETHDLLHNSVESPQADNLYRGHATLVDGVATVNLDEAAGMTEGTFVLLNRDIQCFTSNEDGWTAVRGSVTGNVLTIEAQDSTCVDTVSWLVVGERQDDEIKASKDTDDEGHLIVEPLTNRVSEADIAESEARMEAARQAAIDEELEAN